VVVYVKTILTVLNAVMVVYMSKALEKLELVKNKWEHF
jgi:hypothetical protein